MALNKKPTFVNRPNLDVLRLRNSDGIGEKVIVDGEPEGKKIVSVIATGEDVDRIVTLVIMDFAGALYDLVSVTVPADAGRDPSIPPVDMLASVAGLPKDADGQSYLFLMSDGQLQARVDAAVSPGSQVNLFAMSGDFAEE